jgi:protein-disulfide isomerase
MVLATGGSIVLALIAIGLALPRGSADDAELVTPPATYQADLIDGETLGSATAPVVIELYSDFQCPACKLFVTEQLHRLVGEFVAPGTVRIEAKDIAFLGRGNPDESLELAVGARCAGEQDRYWPFHDLVFWNQGRENRGDHSEAFIDRIAAAASLDQDAFKQCIDRPDVRKAITGRTQEAIGAGIGSTPTLLVNGQPVVGVPQYEQLAALIRSLAAVPSAAPGS